MQAVLQRLFGQPVNGAIDRAESSVARLRQLEEHVTFPDLHQDFAELFADTDVMVLVGEATEDRFIWVNRVVERVLGYTPEDFCSRSMWTYIHPDDVAITQGRYVGMQQEVTRPSRFANRYRHREGHYVRLRWATSRWREGRCLCLAFPAHECGGAG